MIQWDLIPTILVALILSHWANYIIQQTLLRPLLKHKQQVNKMDLLAQQLKQKEDEKK